MYLTRIVKKSSKLIGRDLWNFVRNFLLACVIGAGVGAYSALFALLINWTTSFRSGHQWLIFLLPVGGLAIIGFYHLLRVYQPKGTNRVLRSISSNESLPIVMAPLITVSTAITHLVGGSAGREGAALQIGGCLGMNFGKLLRLKEQDLTILTMCGMSAAFSALFGTPLTATIFAMEVISIGIMHYSAIVPCAVSSVVGFEMAKLIGVSHESFADLVSVPDFGWFLTLKVVGFGILCAVLSVLFCQLLHKTEHLYRRFIANPYLRAVAGGIFVLTVTMCIGTSDYEGAGMDIIASALSGQALWYAFLLKMLLTALTLGSGFKGGEIIPTIFVGATFGCVVGPLLGIPASMAAALGVCGLFCGVTNCPLASLAMSFELFGFKGVWFYLIVTAISYRLSGYYGLYSGQKIIYSKSLPRFINRSAKK